MSTRRRTYNLIGGLGGMELIYKNKVSLSTNGNRSFTFNINMENEYSYFIYLMKGKPYSGVTTDLSSVLLDVDALKNLGDSNVSLILDNGTTNNISISKVTSNSINIYTTSSSYQDVYINVFRCKNPE